MFFIISSYIIYNANQKINLFFNLACLCSFFLTYSQEMPPKLGGASNYGFNFRKTSSKLKKNILSHFLPLPALSAAFDPA